MIHICAVVALVLGAPEEAEFKVTAGPAGDDLQQAVLQAEVAAPAGAGPRMAAVLLDKAGKEVAVQQGSWTKGAVDGPTRFTWIVPSLKKGETAEWTLKTKTGEGPAAPARISIAQLPDKALAVDIGGKPFTRLVEGEWKPYLYPLLLEGTAMTRHWPMEKGFPGEDHDHPHQKSFWFTHGLVNGVDFWSEGGKAGKTVQTSTKNIGPGPVFGGFLTSDDWNGPDGKKLLSDTRAYLFFDLGPAGRLIDFEVTLMASEGPVVLGDTKEGTFGIRLAESMKEENGGRIENSRGGVGMKQTWGKQAEWVDYVGKVDGKTVGVAILDAPDSFRHPTTWHVRDYGLFAANPFGLRDFTGDKDRDGSHRLEKGQSLKFHYRVLLHPGTTAEERVAEVYRGFANPPPVKVEAVK